MNESINSKIDDEAAHWAAIVDARPLLEDEERDLEVWLSGDIRHLGAYAKALAVSKYADRARALGPGFSPAQVTVVRETRPSRRVLVMGGAVAASLVVAGGVALELQRRGYRTQVGEIRVIPLEDGSVITLNTASAIAVDYSRDRRDIRLLEGEALFDVAEDFRRPFTVEAGELQVHAIVTSFTVALLPQQPARVLVRRGEIEVERPNFPLSKPMRLLANTCVTAPNAAPITAKLVPPSQVDRELSWRLGRIAFTGQTLKEAAESFARYSETRIVIEDPAIASKTITGLFVSNDPVAFAKAVAMSLGLHAETGEGVVRLSR